jgi:ATP-binding cassette subfamily B multidrug efflux pump
MVEFSTEEKQVKIADLKVAKSLWPYIKPYFWMLCISTFLVFLVTALELLMPLFTQMAFDGFILPVDDSATGIQNRWLEIDSFKTFCFLFSGLVAAMFILDFCQTLFMEYTGQTIILNLRIRLFSHISFLPVSFFDKNSSGRLVSRVAGDVENMNEMFTSILIFIFKDLVLMAGVLVILCFIDFKLGIFLSLLVPVIMISIFLFSKMLRSAFRTIRQKIAEINHSFAETITGIKVVQTTTSQSRFFERFRQLNFEHFTATLLQIRIFSIFMPFIGFLGILSTAIIIWTGSFQVVENNLTIGQLIAFLTYMKLFFRPLRELSEKFNLLQNALASAERIIGVLQQDQAKQRREENRQKIDQIQTLELNKIDFSYKPDEQVLKNVSFSLNKGRSIGIVGHTGSGKSSIINLITGFYTPDQGDILINGFNTRAINIRDIRDKTALVMQDPILFSGSVIDNICPPGFKGPEKMLEKALKQANCHFLFEKFDGLNTRIEEGGRPLSSGEKQLVCIARAFAFNPDLIIFDEATSYMDSQSEHKVHDAMNKLMHGRLSIIIAHRLSTVRECDHIILLRDGKIREQGNHDQLTDLKQEYYHLLLKEKI